MRVATDSQGNFYVDGKLVPQGDKQPDIKKHNHKMPSKRDMAKGLAGSFAAIAKSGVKICTPDEYNSRYSVCKECEFMDHDRCCECGCFMKIKAKFKAMKCPVNKW